MINLVYPFIFTDEALRYDYGFPHAEWRQKPQAPGTKSNIDNIEAADSKNKISRKVDEPFITVTRKTNLETLFKQSRPELEKPDDSEKRVAPTTQRKSKRNLKFQVKRFPIYIPLLVRRTSQLQFSLCHCNHATNLANLRNKTLRTQ